MGDTISRRGFLTGATATGALAVLGLAGCAPSANAKGNDDGKTASASVESGVAPSVFENLVPAWLGLPPEIADSDIVETRECDLLIVGAGNGGMVAAAYAADLGVDFIVAEQNITVGSTRHWYGAVNTSDCIEAGLEVDTERTINEIARAASYKCDQRVIRTWINESAEMHEFVKGILAEEGLKVEFDTDTGLGTGGTDYYVPPIQHTYVTADGGRGEKARNEIFEEYIQKKGHEVSYGLRLAKLAQDSSGKVTGAIFETADGFVKIDARKGVMLSTGGYADNPEMLMSLSPITVRSVTAMGWLPTNDGMGIKTALWAGAVKDTESAGVLFNRGLVAPGTKAGYTEESIAAGKPMFPGNGQFNPGSQPFLKVNLNGERFFNENANYDASCFSSNQQPGGVWISIWDANFKEDVQRFHSLGCAALTRMTVDQYVAEGGKLDQEVEKGTLQKADTLEELAEKLQIPKDTFLATVERYNELFDKQDDEDFGKNAYHLSSLRNPPYYGATLGGTLLTTIDGIRIDKDMRALNGNAEAIEGLYAIGDCSGSVFSGNYPNLMHGFACGRTMTEAMHVVKQMASA